MVESTVTTLRLPKNLLDRAEALAAQMADDEQNMMLGRMSRSVVLRMAVLRGLELLEAEAAASSESQRGGKNRR